jgi:hypothetical protein
MLFQDHSVLFGFSFSLLLSQKNAKIIYVTDQKDQIIFDGVILADFWGFWIFSNGPPFEITKIRVV